MKSLKLMAIAMLAFVGIGTAESKPVAYRGPAYRPRRDSFRTRIVEYKDEPAATAAAVADEIRKFGDRLAGLEHANAEQKDFPAAVKNLGEGVSGLKAELEGIRNDAPELKAFISKATDRLDAMETRLNGLGIHAAADAGNAKPKRYGECKSLDADMRGGKNIEVKALDSDLKPQTIFHDTVVPTDYPLLEMAFRVPVISDAPRFSYPSGTVVVHKGVGGGSDNVEQKVIGTVYNYQYQPTLAREDVNDTGSFLLDRAAEVFAEGTRAALDLDLITNVQAVAEDTTTAGYNQFVSIPLSQTATASTWTENDIDLMIASLPKRYRSGAVFVGTAAMTATLSNIRNAATGVSLWRPSMAVGVPPTLKGYAYVEDENVNANRLMLINPRRALRIGERELPNLSNIERLGGDYKPCFDARYAPGVYDPRGAVIKDVKPSA